MFSIDPQSATPLVRQIVHGVMKLVEAQTLRPGMKMPSIRQFAQAHGVSLFTVVEAYDRLVAQGVLLPRANAGFYVKRHSIAGAENTEPEDRPAFDSSSYLRSIFDSHRMEMRPGCGWLPNAWLFDEGLQRGIRRLANATTQITGYGNPRGYGPLRRLLADVLVDREIACKPEQVLLTQGSSQGLELAARRLVRAGDVVLIDEPGHATLMSTLRFMGARLVGAPRTPDGYDLAALEQRIVEHCPRVFFTQPRMQNPTGSIAQTAQLHRVLRLAEQHEMLIVENDIYADLDAERRPCLASLDQMARVIYAGSFSKTVSPNLRVGFLAASPEVVEELAQMKMMAGLTSSEFSERIAYEAVTDARWRRHLKTVRERLSVAQGQVAERLQGLGFQLFCESRLGLFLWACHPERPDSSRLSFLAADESILMGPGHLFLPSTEQQSPWMRFNVAYSTDDRIYGFLERQLGRAKGRSGAGVTV